MWAQRADLDGGNVEDLVTAGLSIPRGIALDLVSRKKSRGKMYWVDGGTAKIQRADLDGGNVEDVITDGVGYIGLALDLASAKSTFRR